MIAAIAVRGVVGARQEIKDAMSALRLRNKHVCVLLKDDRATRGALLKAKDFITFGAVSAETQKLLAEKRGEKDADGKLKPWFRLHPPRGGWERKGIKVAWRAGGALGERGDMDALIKRMI